MAETTVKSEGRDPLAACDLRMKHKRNKAEFPVASIAVHGPRGMGYDPGSV